MQVPELRRRLRHVHLRTPSFAERRFLQHGVPFGPKQLGYIWMFAGFLGILLQGPTLGRLVKRFGERLLNRVGFAAYATAATCFWASAIRSRC